MDGLLTSTSRNLYDRQLFDSLVFVFDLAGTSDLNVVDKLLQINEILGYANQGEIRFTSMSFKALCEALYPSWLISLMFSILKML